MGASGYLELQGLTTIRTFVQLSEALFAKGCLEASGVECYLIDDNIVRMVNVFDGIKLKVRQEEAEAALALLNRPFIVRSGEAEVESE